MKLSSLIEKIGGRRRGEAATPPALGEAMRFGYGPFRFKTRLPRGLEYTIQASTDLRTWTVLAKGKAAEETLEYIDSEAFKFTFRFYRVLAGEVHSANVIGYASVTLAPGFSMIANPFDSSQTVSDIFKDWPEGTGLNKFDTRLFRLVENERDSGKWTNPTEKLAPSEGAIFFNPTSDYKSVSFVGEVLQGNLSVPIPAGFSIRSSLMPKPGHLADDLGFPIGNGDVIHIFDREKQKYVLHPYEDGKWSAGPPIVSVGESFWVAKADPGNWTVNFQAE
ncbi:MAG TPA: hypothetical protein VN578_08645 [Candidatus Binatia bacterium]|nr:hypothetical protein [Candidatus Binatia bacterium]